MLDSILGSEITLDTFLLCTAVSLVLGLGLAFVANYREKSSSSLAVTLAVLTFVLLGGMLLVLSLLGVGRKNGAVRTLKITIPENLDYDGLFDDILANYTQSSELVKVKTSNMGTLYELEYAIALPGNTVPKAFLDELRCRNGNLNITCGRETAKEPTL